MFFMNWPFSHLPLFHGVVFPNISYVQFWTFHVIPKKTRDFVCKLAPTPHHEDGGVVGIGFMYRSGHFTQFLVKKCFGKDPHFTPTFDRWRIGKCYFSKQILANHAVSKKIGGGKLPFSQAPPLNQR